MGITNDTRHTLPLTFPRGQKSHHAAASRKASSLPISAQPGARRAAGANKSWPSGAAAKLKSAIPFTTKSVEEKEQKAKQKLGRSLPNFILQWSRRHDVKPSLNNIAKSLETVCKNMWPLCTAGTPRAAYHHDHISRARASTYEELIGSGAVQPAKAVLNEVIQDCLTKLELTQVQLCQLYDDRMRPETPPTDHDLIKRVQNEKRREIAVGLLNMLEHAVVRELAIGAAMQPATAIPDVKSDVKSDAKADAEPDANGKPAAKADTRADTESGTTGDVTADVGHAAGPDIDPDPPPLKQLLDTAAQNRSAPETVKQALEKLRDIGEWLATPTRPAVEVLNLVLNTLTEEDLGKLVVQAWPKQAAQIQNPAAQNGYGEEPVAMQKAIDFEKTCQGDALRLWRDALTTQLRRRKRAIAANAAETVLNAHGRSSVNAAVRDANIHAQEKARLLAGDLPDGTLLSDVARHQTRALMLHLIRDEPLRADFLRSLSPRDLSSLLAVLDSAVEMTDLKNTVGANANEVRNEELKKRRRAVEETLTSLYETLASNDRAAASVKLAALGEEVARLTEFQRAFSIAMPDLLSNSLRDAITDVRALLFGNRLDQASVLHGLSDIELGRLRNARNLLASFDPLVGTPEGPWIDKSVLMAEIGTRVMPPAEACIAMKALLDTIANTDAPLFEIITGLRDVADILVRHNERCVFLGEEDSANSHSQLALDTVRDALQRFNEQHDDGPARLRRAIARHPDITGHTLRECLMALANASMRFSSTETARLAGCLAMLGMARYLEEHLYGICMEPEDVPEIATASDELRRAIASEFGVEWDGEEENYLPTVTHARPTVTYEHHLRFQQYLLRPLDADGAQTRPYGLLGPNGRMSWFRVSQAFELDFLEKPGMSLAVEGISARGRPVIYPGFDHALENEARRPAVAAALQALQDLAGNDMPALTRQIHRGVLDNFTTALSWYEKGSPLRLPNGDRVQILEATPDIAKFRIKRRPNGSYHIETTLIYSTIDKVISKNSVTGASETVLLDPTRSRLKATFCLATNDDCSAVTLWEAVDIRDTLVVREGHDDG